MSLAPRRGNAWGLPLLAVAGIVCAFAFPAAADTAILDAIVEQFERATGTWFANLLPIAHRLFLTLATIELVVSGMWWALERESLPEIFVAFLKRIVALSFFFMLLLNAHLWMPAVIDSFLLAGQVAGGATALSPSGVMGQGIDLAASLFGELKGQGFLLNPSGSLLAVFCAGAVILAFAFIAAQFVVLLVEIYVVIGGGVLLLAFAASRFSIGFSEKYLGYAFSTGVKAFVLMLIIGVGSGLVSTWQPTIVGARLEDAFAILAASVVYLAVAWHVPSFASAMIGGMPQLGLGAVTAPLAGGAALGTAFASTGGAAAATTWRSAAALGAVGALALPLARTSGVSPGAAGSSPGSAPAQNSAGRSDSTPSRAAVHPGPPSHPPALGTPLQVPPPRTAGSAHADPPERV